MIDLAQQQNLISSSIIDSFEVLFTKLEDLLPKELPALIHGDLWNGNFLVNQNEDVVQEILAIEKMFGIGEKEN